MDRQPRPSGYLSIAVTLASIVMITMIVTLAILFTRSYWNSGRSSNDTLENDTLVEISPTILVSGTPESSEPLLTTTPQLADTSLVMSDQNKIQSLIQAKMIVQTNNEQRATWTPTPIPTTTPTPSPSPMPTFVIDPDETTTLRPENIGPAQKWIDVNLTSQTLVAFEGSIPVFQTLVSTGTAKHPTVTGQFRIWLRFKAQDMNGYRLGYDYFLKGVPYVQYFYQDYSLHGTYWHNNFGHPMSHGCVNLPTPAAEWLFNWAEYGTLVNIHK